MPFKQWAMGSTVSERCLSYQFLQSSGPCNLYPWCPELVNVLSWWQLVIAVSIKIGDGVFLYPIALRRPKLLTILAFLSGIGLTDQQVGD